MLRYNVMGCSFLTPNQLYIIMHYGFLPCSVVCICPYFAICFAVSDADGDIVRCRWAVSAQGECGDVCQVFPATLDQVTGWSFYYQQSWYTRSTPILLSWCSLNDTSQLFSLCSQLASYTSKLPEFKCYCKHLSASSVNSNYSGHCYQEKQVVRVQGYALCLFSIVKRSHQ